MLKLILTLALLAASAIATDAIAYSCTTTCQTYGNQTTCQRTCW